MHYKNFTYNFDKSVGFFKFGGKYISSISGKLGMYNMECVLYMEGLGLDIQMFAAMRKNKINKFGK